MRMRAPLALALALAVLAPPARAHAAAGGALIQPGRPRHVPTALDSVPHPWPGVALVLSATGTALPVVIADAARRHDRDPRIGLAALAAEIVMPAAGHIYAGLGRRAALGVGVRAASFGIVAAGAATAGYWSGETSYELTWGHLVVLGGAVLIAASAVWDVIVVPTDVERSNGELLHQHTHVGLRALPDRRGTAVGVVLRF